MVPAEWVSAVPPWTLGGIPDGKSAASRVLFTRSVRRRNFTGFPFWVSCPPEICSVVAMQARAFAGTAGFSTPVVLSDYPPEAIGFFRERQWLPDWPVTFPGQRDYKLLFLGSDPAEYALAGEVEHWTQIRVRSGLPETIDVSATAGLMETGGLFCHSPGYGFLTSNPSFAGSGLQMECGVHLPASTALRRIQAIQQAMNALGLELQPLMARAPGGAEAGFFRVLSRGGMKFPEHDLYQWFAEQVKSLLATEIEALEKWRNREKNKLEDRVYRSLRLLQEARTLDYTEFLTFASFARAGVYLGHFPASLIPKLEDLRVRAQPFHISILHGKIPPGAADVFRAEFVRKELKESDSDG
jgi:hypothetical protein